MLSRVKQLILFNTADILKLYFYDNENTSAVI